MLTGASGFIGSHVAHKLLASGLETHLLVRRKTGRIRRLQARGASIHCGSVQDPRLLARAMGRADTVIHCAGATTALNRSDYYRANVDFTAHLLQQMQAGQRIIFVSSQAVVGPSGPHSPLDETAPPAPLTDYGRSKQLAEARIRCWGRQQNGDYTILRPCTIYGPRDTNLLLFFQLINHGLLPLLGRGSNLFSLLYVDDLVNAIITAAAATPGRTYHVAGDEPCSWRHFGEAAQAALKTERVWRFNVPQWLLPPVAWIADAIACLRRQPAALNRQRALEFKQKAWLISNRKLCTDLNWRPSVALSTGLGQTVRWYRHIGWL